MHEDIYDEFVEKATKLAANKKLGNPLQEGCEQGPQARALVSDSQAIRVSGLPASCSASLVCLVLEVGGPVCEVPLLSSVLSCLFSFILSFLFFPEPDIPSLAAQSC